MPATTFGTRTNIARAAPTTTAVLLVVSRPRAGLSLVNNGTQIVYIGTTSVVTTTTGFPLEPSVRIIDNTTEEAFYAIVASGTGDVGVYESY